MNDLDLETFNRDFREKRETLSDLNSSSASVMLSIFDDSEVLESDVILTTRQSSQKACLVK